MAACCRAGAEQYGWRPDVKATNRVLVVGVDHRCVSLDTLAACHALREEQGCEPPLVEGQGLVALATCHRLELYLDGVVPCHAKAVFNTWLWGSPEAPAVLDQEPVVRRGEEAGRHLLTVCSGLESAVLGEDQILMQVRRAYRSACDAQAATPRLHRLFHTALRAGKRVRSQTEVGSGGRSLSGAAIGVLQRLLGGLAERRVLVLGVGEMGELAACRLSKRGVGELLLCNRTLPKAEALAKQLGARVLPWEWRATALSQVDAVVCATGAKEAVINARCLRETATGRARPFVAIDLSVPRNLGLSALEEEGLQILDVEALTRRLASDDDQRQRAAVHARAIVEDVLGEWTAWVEARHSYSVKSRGRCRRLRESASG